MEQQQYQQQPPPQQYQQNGGFRGGGRGGGRGRGRGGGGRGFGRGRGGGGRGGGGRGRGRGGFSHSYSHHQQQQNDQQQSLFEDYGPQSHVRNHSVSSSTGGDGYFQSPPVPAAPAQQQQFNSLPGFLNVAAYVSGAQQHPQQAAYPPQSQYQQPQSGYGAPVPSTGYGSQPAYPSSNPQFQQQPQHQQQRSYDAPMNAASAPPLPNQPPPPSEQGTESEFVPPLPKQPAPPLPVSPALAPAVPPTPCVPQQTQPQSGYSDALYSRQQAYAPVGTQQQQQPAPPLMPTPQPQYHAPQVQYQPQYQVHQQPPPLPLSYAQPNGYHHHSHYQQQQQQYAQPAPVYAAPPQQYQQQPVHQPQPPLPRSSQPTPPQQQQQYQQFQQPGSRPPPSTYCCHKCGQPGHWIQDCQSTQSNYNRGGSDRDQRPASHGGSSYQQPAYYQQPQPPAPYHQQQQQYQRPPQQDIHHQVVHQPPPPSTSQSAPPSYYTPHASSTERLDQEDTHYVHESEVPEHEQQERYGASLAECPPLPDALQQQQWCCENCDKSFTMESQFDAHVKTHVACHAPGCDFSASKRVVGAHFQTAHGQFAGSGLKEIDVEGQKFMVLVGNSPEDIAQWRADRRKKWPSANKQSDEQPAVASALESAPVKQQSKKRKLSTATVDSTGDLEDGEVDEEEPQARDEQRIEPSAAGDADTSEPSPKRQKRVWLCKNFLRNQCRFGDQCKFSHDRKDVPCRSMLQKGKCSKADACLYSHDAQQVAEAAAKVKTKNASKPSKGEKVLEEQWKTEQSSLLRKLLKKDMRVEQHQMLQIVRALVTNQFFQQEAQPVAQAVSVKVVSSSDAL